MRKVWFLVAGMMVLSACSNDESPVGSTDELVEIRLTSSIEAQSRATHDLDQQIANGETVYVWVDDAGLTEGAELYEDNQLTVADGGSLTGGEAMYFPSTGNAVNIYAIHGNLEYTDFWGETVTHTVAQDQQSTVATAGAGYALSDLVYCEKDAVGRTTSAVELTFKHLLSKVEVVLYEGDGAPNIAKAEIINTQLQAEFTPTKENGVSVAATGDAGAIVIDDDVTTGDEVLNEGIIVPQTLERGTQFIRITTGESGELTYTLTEATTFEAGKKYHYTITVKLTGLEVTTSVDDWDDGTSTEDTAKMKVDYTYTDTDGTRTYTVYNEAGLLVWSEYTRSGNWGTNCILAADITLSAPEEDGGSNWTTVGDDSSRYTGTFDGNGYTISGLTINASSDYQGLIGYLGSGGEVKNLTLTEVSITSTNGDYIGGVVGRNRGTVTACSASGIVSGDSDIGGVAGYNYGTVTDCCFASGTVSGNSDIGGVVGYNRGTVTACYSNGTVSGSRYLGGVVGYNHATVNTCYWADSSTEEEGVATYGIGCDTSYAGATDENATKVDGTTVSWTDAATAMNEALSAGGYSWQYTENTDEETSENEPLILVSTATE